MKTLRSVLAPSSAHTLSARGQEAVADVRPRRIVRLSAPSSRGSCYPVFRSERSGTGVSSLRRKTGRVMATQSDVEENVASSTSFTAG